MKHPDRSRRGFVVIAVTFSIITLLGVTGLAVDLGRMYVAKSEAQAFCDAAALGAAVRLDGNTTGIVAAKDSVSQAYGRRWNWGSETITSPTVEFSKGLAGPWATSPVSPAGYSHARVQTSIPVAPYFLAALNFKTANVAASAVAAQVGITRIEQGLAPYTVVGTDETSPTLGLVVGNEYDLQWPQYNDTRSGCGPNNPKKCFNSPPCKDESPAAELAVTEYWGSNINGYWGSNQNSEIRAEVLDLVQTRPIALGDLITMSSGNKNIEAQILDQRVNQDIDLLHNTGPTYFNNPHNGRRLIGVPVVKPGAGGTYVIGFAAFLLESNAGAKGSTYYASGNGNDPFCAVYVGPYVVGSSSTGAASSTGAFRVALVQ